MTTQDRTGRTIPQHLIDKAERLNVETVHDGSLYKVYGDTDTYLVAVTSIGEAACQCKWARETDSMCSHVMGVWLHGQRTNSPVHINRIDGYRLEMVQPDDPFKDLA